MFLYLARHAWAGHYGDPGWPDDSLRKLTPDGARRFVQVVETLAERGFAPKRIATSPYTRCRQTAEIISEYTRHNPPIDDLAALEPGSDLEAMLKWTQEHYGGDVCWCGHNPDIGRLAADLISGGDVSIRFAKGAIAAIRFDGSPAAGSGELCWLVTAKTLGF